VSPSVVHVTTAADKLILMMGLDRESSIKAYVSMLLFSCETQSLMASMITINNYYMYNVLSEN